MNINPHLNIGDVLTRPKCLGIIEHCGVLVGHDTVLHNTPGKGEHLATVREFSGGAPVKVRRTGANPSGVWARCQKILSAPKAYDPLERNCEHTTNEVAHGEAKSPQIVGVALLVIALIGGGFLLARSR